MSSDLHAPDSPYKGLRPFEDTVVDALLFFGRERECEVIAANLMAARLTVLYGASGVGKSSVLSAGVVHQLRELARDRREFVVASYSSWSDEDPVEGIADAAREAIEDLLGFQIDDGLGSLAERLAAWSELLAGEIYLALDQFEEYFLYHGHEGGGSLLDELPALVTEPSLRVHVLLGIREDALARLDVFKARIPGLFANYLRLEQLEPEAARAAIERPLQRWWELAGESVEIEPDLVEAILEAVTAEQLVGNGAGPATANNTIEPPYLQIVLERIWEAEREAGSRVLRRATLVELGGARTIVGEHLERALASLDTAQRDTAAAMFGQLVTPSGTKIAHDVADLASYAGSEEADVRGVAATLVEERILRPVEAPGDGGRVEIFHDVLGGAISDWRRRHEAERRLDAERREARRRHRRVSMVFALTLVALAVMTAVAIYALDQRSEAREQARAAQAQELAAQALVELPVDPARSLRLALEAARLEPLGEVVNVLRRALTESRVRAVAQPAHTAAPRALQVRGSQVNVVYADGRLRAYGLDGRLVRDTRLAGPVGGAAFAPRGDLLATFSGSTARVVRGRDGTLARTLRHQFPVTAVRWGTGGRMASAAGREVTVFSRSGKPRIVRYPASVDALALGTGAIAAASGHAVRLSDVRTGRPLRRIVDRASVHDVSISPDGTLVAVASADGAARVWSLRTGVLQAIMLGHGTSVSSVEFSSDGKRLVTISTDATARVWDSETGRGLVTLSGHREALTAAALSGNDDVLATASRAGDVRIWDPNSEPRLEVLARLQVPVRSAEFDDGGRLVDALGNDGVRRTYRFADGALLRREPGAGPAVQARTTDGRMSAAAVGSEVRISGAEVRVLRGHRDVVTAVEFSPDGMRILTASRDHSVRVWSVATGTPLREIQAHSGRVSDGSFSPNGRWIVTAGPSAAALFDSGATKPVFYLRGHREQVTSASFSPDGQWILTTGVDGTVRRYRCEICGELDELLVLAERRLRAARSVSPPR